MKKYLQKFIVILIIVIMMLIFSINCVYADIPSYIEKTEITWDDSWKFAEFSNTHSGTAYLYKHTEDSPDRNNITVCVNAGHGTSGMEKMAKYTYCHPDKTPKVTGGSTDEGEVLAQGVTSGMTFNDGTTEASATLRQAIVLRDLLLSNGFNVLMIREEDDVQFDNVARSVIANNNADCHVSIHWDSEEPP